MDERDPGMREEDQAVEEALGENLHAEELRELRAALEQKRKAVRNELSQAQTERERHQLTERVHEMNRQIRALQDEEAISAFVENSVRVVMNKPQTSRDDDDEFADY